MSACGAGVAPLMAIHCRMASCLLLNATWEPLVLLPVRRGIQLVLADRAHAVEVRGSVFRSEFMSIEVPIVAALNEYVRIPESMCTPAASRSNVLVRDDNRCGYCGDKAQTIDHIVPTSRGGAARDWRNVIAACHRCNVTVKQDRTPEEAGLSLVRQPFVPTRSDLVLARASQHSELRAWMRRSGFASAA